MAALTMGVFRVMWRDARQDLRVLRDQEHIVEGQPKDRLERGQLERGV